MDHLTNIAAWWGAAIATFVFFWDIYKWLHSGPIINVTVLSNMQFVGYSTNIDKNKKFISVEVTNTGERKTTITHLVGFYYNSLLSKLLNKKTKSFIAIPSFGSTIPCSIEPGGRWIDGIEQTKEIEDMIQNGYLYFGIYHSSSKKPVMKRVIVHKINKK